MMETSGSLGDAFSWTPQVTKLQVHGDNLLPAQKLHALPPMLSKKLCHAVTSLAAVSPLQTITKEYTSKNVHNFAKENSTKPLGTDMTRDRMPNQLSVFFGDRYCLMNKD